MKKIGSLGAVVFIGLLSGLLVGCASTSRRPDWILKGSGAFKKEQKKSLFGVGIAQGITSEALRRTTADNRAIAEVSKQLSVMSTSMMRDYMSSADVPETEKSSGEQYVENTIKTFTSNVVSGVKIVDRWDDGKTTSSLASLSLDELKNMAGKIQQLSEQVREHIKANAEKAFDKLEEEQEKRGD